MNEKIIKLAEKLIDAARAKKAGLSFAESCTGGMIGAYITDIAGASDAFLGSAVTYSNSAKHNILGVTSEVLDKYGAVSGQCAEQMAEGSRRIYGSDVAVSVTGVAGPGGGSAEKPVGTVWFGCSSAKGTRSFVRYFSGDREEVREATAAEAIEAAAKELI